MKKTFRKALASILAVLMVICSVPFLANAEVGSANHQWWTDADLPITAAPDYTPWSTSSTYTFGKEMKGAALKNGAAKRWNYKPIFAVTVSNMGTASSTYEEMDAYQANHYGAAGLGFTAAKAAGVILNPTDLKAGQRIALTFEYAGVDVLNAAQILADYDSNYLVPGGYWDLAVDNDCDTWDANIDYAKTTASPYTFITLNSVVFSNSFNATWVSGAGAGSGGVNSNYIGKNDAFDSQFGGIISNTIFFEVQQDCDLRDVITWRSTECFISPINNANLSDGLDNMSFAPTDRTCVLVAPTIWTGSADPVSMYQVKINPYENGSVTINDMPVDKTAGLTVDNIPENNSVTLKATADAGSTFLGWKANDGTTVSTNPTFEAVVNANIEYTPVFAPIPASNEIVLTFVDAFENIVGVYTITKGDTSFVAPEVPARAGYTANGWSVTDFAALTENTVVTPKYTKITDTNYTVTVPAGSTIAVGTGAAESVTSVSVPYNTQVTVYNASATSWKINGATVAYGNTYTFYVGADVELTIDTATVAEETPVVGSVGVEVSGTRVSFLATRKIQTAAGCVQVNAGFIYGTTGVTASTELVDVNGTSVKAVYTKTDSEQYSISFTVTPGSGKTYNGKAFITYKNQTTGEINVAYANLQTYNA